MRNPHLKPNRTNGKAGKTSVRIDPIRERTMESAPAVAVPREEFLVTKRSRLIRSVGALALVSALAFLAGCGGGGNKSSSGAGSNKGKTYPLLRVIWDAPDYMDPQLYYTVAAFQLDNYVWSGLLGYNHVAVRPARS